MIKNAKCLRLRKQVNPPSDSDWIYSVQYSSGGILLAGCGMTEQEAMTNFCNAYLRKYKLTNNKNETKS